MAQGYFAQNSNFWVKQNVTVVTIQGIAKTCIDGFCFDFSTISHIFTQKMESLAKCSEG